MGTQVFLAYMYGPRNAGDMALNYGALDLLSAVGGINVTGLSRFSANHEGFTVSKARLEAQYPNFRMIPYPVSYDRHGTGMCRQALSHLAGLRMYCASAMGLRGIRHDKLNSAIGRSDYMLFNGGNVLFSRGFRDFARLAGVTYPLQRALAMKKPLVFLPQSIPAASGLGARCIRHYLEKASLVSFRESMSAELIGLNRKDAIGSLDLAFFINRTTEGKADRVIASSGLTPFQFVPMLPRATTLGDQGRLQGAAYEQTVRLVVRLCERVLQLGFQPVFVVQVQPDRAVAEDCQAALRISGYHAAVIEQYDPLVLRELYASARAVITMRLHAAIFALSAGTPAIGLYRSIWGQKMPGIYSDLRISNLCCQFDHGNTDALASINAIADDDAIERHRRTVREVIDAKSSELIARLRCALQ